MGSTWYIARIGARRACGWRSLGADHGQQHFERGDRFQRVGRPCRHDDHLARLYRVRIAGNADFDFTVEHLHDGI